MSATNRGAVRSKNDFYETPDWLTQALVPHLKLHKNTYIYEPACGQGAIVRVLLSNGVCPGNVLCADVNEDFVEHVARTLGTAVRHQNFLQKSFDFHEVRPDLIITNPPYSLAESFVREALDVANNVEKDVTVAMLLRLNFLGGQKRAKFLRENPCDVYVSPRRPSFTGQGTDATEYAWFVWRPERTNRVFILPTEKEA